MLAGGSSSVDLTISRSDGVSFKDHGWRILLGLNPLEHRGFPEEDLLQYYKSSFARYLGGMFCRTGVASNGASSVDDGPP